MFKPNTTAYFVFRGDFNTGRYKGFYCLPMGFKYFPFIPITYVKSCGDLRTCDCIVHMGDERNWFMLTDLLEEEFSFDKFILETMAWGGSVSKEQFKSIVETL